ncbi:hypothetical protein WJX82_006948 [Trebouxia sp. C0006]
MGICSSKPATKDAPAQPAQTQAPMPASPAQASPSPRRATMEQKEAVAGATEQAKDAVQQAGEQVQTRVKELERMQQEIERLKEAPVSVSEDAHNQLRIQQLEREVLQVQQEINVTLEIAEQEIKEAVLSAQASLKQDDGTGYAGQTSQIAAPQLQANGPTGGYTSAPMLQDTANVNGTAGSTGDGMTGPYSTSRNGTSTIQPITGNSISGVQLSSKPILGGEGTFTAQPVTQPWQHATATAASNGPQRESQNRQAVNSTSIDVGRSTVGTEALEAGRAGMSAHPELQAERSLRSTYSAGRDSPAFPSDSPSHSSAQGQSYHQSVSEAPSQSRDSGQAPDDGQAEDLVSDVQSRAREASQSAVIAGQEQQQKLQHLIDSGLGPMQGPMHGGASAPPAWMNKVHDQLPAPPTPVPNSASGHHASPGSGFRTDGPSASVGFPPMTTITSPRGGEHVGGGEIDWGRVQEIQKQAMLAGQEAMEQSRKGLMEVKEAIQRRTQMQ